MAQIDLTSLLFTPQAGSSGKGSGVIGKAGLGLGGASGAAFSGDAAGFLAMLLSTIGAEGTSDASGILKTPAAGVKTKTTPNSDDTADALALAAATDTADETDAVETVLTSGQSIDILSVLKGLLEETQPEATASITAETPGAAKLDEDQIKTLNDFLNFLLSGLPQEEKTDKKDISESLLAWLTAAPEQTPKSPGLIIAQDKASDKAAPALIAAGLDIQKLTALVSRILKAAQNAPAENTEANDNFSTLLAKLMPAKKEEAVLIPRGTPALPSSSDATTAAVITAAADDEIATKLNDLVVGGSDEKPLEKKAGLHEFFKIIEDARDGKPAAPASASDTKGDKAGPSLSTIRSDIQYSQNAGAAAISTAASASLSAYPDGMEWSQNGATGTQSLTLTGPAILTSLVNSAQNAAQAHPATQAIATAMVQNAANGQKNITVRLEPAELGRVEIRMEFSKDKTMKAHMLVEKPETYMMLQRDSHVLQRALQEAGLESGGGSLSFELAQDGNLFGHDGNERGGSNNSGGGSAGYEDGADDIAETTMTWQIDPQTGTTHYNILA